MEVGNIGLYNTRSHGMDEAYVKRKASSKDVGRQPRSPSREAQASRDKSTSSNEKRDSAGKRNSFFTKRPKSSLTVGSNESVNRSQTPLLESRERALAPAISEPTVKPAESDTSKSRFLFGRGRKNRKSASTKLRASSPVDADDEWDSFNRVRKEEKHRRSSSGDRRMRISNPFGFQHSVKIEKTRNGAEGALKEPGDIFADFRALRKGHRAAIIGPSRDVDSDIPEDEVKPEKRPPPLRPKRSDELLLEEPNSSSLHGMLPLRQIRSAEAFSSGIPPSILPQPVGMAASGHHGRRPAPLNQTPSIFAPDYSQRPSNTMSLNDEWDRLLPLYDPRAANQMGPGEMGMRPLMQQELVAEPIRSPMFSPPLEQVPEEPEGTLSNRQSVESPRQASIRHAKSSPMLSRTSSKLSRRGNGEHPPVPLVPESPTTGRPASQGSETLGDPDRLSVPIKELEKPDYRKLLSESRPAEFSSWEDDIDFCYQHAAEADCDFDWSVTSGLNGVESDDLYRDDGPLSDLKEPTKREPSYSMTSTASSEGDQYKLSSRVYRVPSKEGVPELDYRSSHSASTNSISVMTPLDKSSFLPADSTRHASKELSKDALTTSLLQRSELTMSQYYDDIVAKTSTPPPEATMAATPPPSIPTRPDSRMANDCMKRLELPPLPTPPPSANQSPVIPVPVESKSYSPRDLSVDTIVAQLRSRGMESPISPEGRTSSEYPPPPPPKSPRTIARQPFEAPPLKTRSHAGTLNAAKLKLIEAQGRLQGLGPTSMPRNNSDDSVVTTIPISKPPTPLKPSYSKPEMSPLQNTNFLDSPSPSTSIATPASSYFNELTSAPLNSQREGRERPRAHRKVSSDSSAPMAPMTTPPTSPPPPRRDDSITGVRPARSSYSLFPSPSASQKQPKPLDLRGANTPMSPPSTGGAFPSPMKTPTGSFFPAGVNSTAGMSSSRTKERRLATT